MSEPNYDRNRVVRDNSNRMMWGIVAAVVVVLIIGGLIYARNYSGNDTSSAVTNTPPVAPSPRP